MFKTVFVAGTAGLLSIVSVCAQAGVVTLVGPVVAPPTQIQITVPTETFNANAGERRFLFDGAAFQAYCSEVTQDSLFPNTYTTSVLTNSGAKYNLLNSLFSQFYASSSATPVASAAMQVAIWEIIEDTNGIDLSTGKFILGSNSPVAVRAMAQNMLTSAINNAFSPNWTFTEYLSVASQDLISGVVGGTQVPLPGGLGLLGIGAIALLTNRRKAAAK
jgi:hypothetical protein